MTQVMQISLDEVLGLERIEPKVIKKNVRAVLIKRDGMQIPAIVNFFTGLRSKIGRTLYLINGVPFAYYKGDAILQVQGKVRKWRVFYLYTTRDGKILALPPSTQKKLLQRVKKLIQEYKKKGIILQII
jgi:hypothetical protein